MEYDNNTDSSPHTDDGYSKQSENKTIAEPQFQEMTAMDPNGPQLKKSLYWYDLMSLGIGCIIGAGIFVTTGRVFTTITGPAIILAYITAGTCCAFASLCYSEFAAMAPNSGSAYAFTSQTLGEFPAWLVGWNLVLEFTISAACVAQGFSSYFQTFIHLCGGNIFPRNADPTDKAHYQNSGASGSGTFAVSYTLWDYSQGANAYLTGSAIDLWAMLLACFLGCLVTYGVSESTKFNNCMVAIKLTVVLFVIILGAIYSSSSNFVPFAPFGYGGLQFFGSLAFGQVNANGAPIGMLAGASTVFFAYIGFDVVTAQSEEAINPGRTLPIGIIGSLSLATSLYIAICLVLSGMIPYSWYDPVVTAANGGISGLKMRHISTHSILADIFAYHGLKWAALIVCIGAIAGLTSVTLVTMMAQPRIFMSMARDGLLPAKFFAEIHPKSRTPFRSCIMLMIVTTLLAGLMPQNVLLDMTNIGTLFAFTFVCISLPIYRYTNPDRPRPFRSPLSSYYFPLVPVLGAGLSIILAFSLDSQNWYRLLGWVGVGLVIYFGYGRRNAKQLRSMRAALPSSVQHFHYDNSQEEQMKSNEQQEQEQHKHGEQDSEQQYEPQQHHAAADSHLYSTEANSNYV